MFSVPECWRPMVPVEMKGLKVFQSGVSPTSSATYPISRPCSCCQCCYMAEYGTSSTVWTYNLHTIIQLEEMNSTTTK